MKKYKFWRNGLLLCFALTFIYGFFGDGYQLDLLATAILFGLFAASVDLSYGYAGILNLGSAVYFGFGSYVCAFVLRGNTEWLFSLNPPMFLVVGFFFTLILSLLIGYVGFRVKASAIHFGLIGLAVTLGFEKLVTLSSLYDITGGSNGLMGVPFPSFADSQQSYFFFTLIVVLLLMLGLWRLSNSDYGKVLRAHKHNEMKVDTMGYNPMQLKLSVTVITASLSFIAGALFVAIIGIASPNLFGVALSMSVLIWIALGGTGTLVGPFVLAIVLKLSENSLSSTFQNTYTLIIGIIFVLMVILAPGGVFSLRKLVTKRFSKAERGGTIVGKNLASNKTN